MPVSLLPPHLDHDALAILHEERGDEDKEDVVEEEGGEEAGADLEAGQPQHLQHVHREHHAQQVLGGGDNNEINSIFYRSVADQDPPDPYGIISLDPYQKLG